MKAGKKGNGDCVQDRYEELRIIRQKDVSHKATGVLPKVSHSGVIVQTVPTSDISVFRSKTDEASTRPHPRVMMSENVVYVPSSSTRT